MSFLSLRPLLVIKHVTWLKINNWNSFGCIEKKNSPANNDQTVIGNLAIEIRSVNSAYSENYKAKNALS